MILFMHAIVHIGVSGVTCRRTSKPEGNAGIVTGTIVGIGIEAANELYGNGRAMKARRSIKDIEVADNIVSYS